MRKKKQGEILEKIYIYTLGRAISIPECCQDPLGKEESPPFPGRHVPECPSRTPKPVVKVSQLLVRAS